MATQKKFSLENFTFNISLIIVAAVIGTFFYLQYAVSDKNAEYESLSIDATMNKTAGQKKIENQVLITQQRLNDFSSLIDGHKRITAFFTGLESVMHPDVFFTGCFLKTKQSAVELSGRAKTFEALGQQVSMLLSAQNLISDAKIEKIGIDEQGNVDFDLLINVEPQALAFNRAAPSQ